jgi:rubrerythrin
MNQLTQKETMLLKDEKSHEELCIKKYTKAINEAHDPQLKQVFTEILSHEQQHLNTINSIMAGQIPAMNQGQQQNQAQANQNTIQSGTYDANDAELCEDALATEKYVSSTYDTTIFEFRNPQIRQVLNHIQKEEQEHGEKIYQYMASHGMYNAQ